MDFWFEKGYLFDELLVSHISVNQFMAVHDLIKSSILKNSQYKKILIQ